MTLDGQRCSERLIKEENVSDVRKTLVEDRRIWQKLSLKSTDNSFDSESDKTLLSLGVAQPDWSRKDSTYEMVAGDTENVL